MTSGIRDRQKHLEESLENLEDLLFEIGKLNSELWEAIEHLQSSMTDEYFAKVLQCLDL